MSIPFGDLLKSNQELVMDDRETLNRRARLRELIAVCFDGFDKGLLTHILAMTGETANQGELSALKRDNGKSFGDKKAKRLTEQIGLHRRWFDFPVGTNIDKDKWLLDRPPASVNEECAKYSVFQRKGKQKTSREKDIDEINALLGRTSDQGIRSALLRVREFASEFPLANKQTG